MVQRDDSSTCFFTWSALLNRLSTRDRQVKFNPSLPITCLFCNLDEATNHFYFACSYTLIVWKYVITRVGKTSVVPFDWSSLVDWAVHALVRNAKVNILAKIIFQACIYFIWVERNSRVYNQCSRQKEELIHQILQNVRYRVFNLSKVIAAFPLF